MSQTFSLNIIDNYFAEFRDLKTKNLLTISDCSDQNGAPFIIKEKE